ncbi:MAG TPA: M56 family metallopeptidase [Gemmatimonadaceae bacterium]|nr:M56 family metallopeptidase [Gemmatimonadaceae bacterium]
MSIPVTPLALPSWLPGPAASARVTAQVYALLLILTALLLLAGLVALALRRAPAGTRVLVWRSAVVALLAVCLGHLLPIELWTGTLPAGLADPLVRLGRLQVALAESAGARTSGAPADVTPGASGVVIVRWLVLLYVSGVLALVLRAVGAGVALRAVARRARPMRDATWDGALREARCALGIGRPVRLLVTSELRVPMTWGVTHPVIGLPRGAEQWSRTRCRAVLLHELAHVRSGDALFAFLVRLLGALFWFHPGVWWLARRLRSESELAADDRVLANGIRASDYAELLMLAADSASGAPWRPAPVALVRRVGLPGRLAAIVDVRRDRRSPGRLARSAAVLLALVVAVPAGAARLAPSRDVLTALLRDGTWDARAYAVVGLAQRPDSIEVARAASRFDPNPRVRAWARLALDRAPGGRPLPFLLNTLPALQAEPR